MNAVGVAKKSCSVYKNQSLQWCKRMNLEFEDRCFVCARRKNFNILLIDVESLSDKLLNRIDIRLTIGCKEKLVQKKSVLSASIKKALEDRIAAIRRTNFDQLTQCTFGTFAGNLKAIEFSQRALYIKFKKLFAIKIS